MKNTKSKIVEKAKQLFNQHGFSAVTIRMIATELGISSGNLNYHFNTREEILEALYFEMVEEFDQRIEDVGSNEITFHTIEHDIFKSLNRMIEFRFIWTDLYNLLRSNNKIKLHFEGALQKRINGYDYLLNYLSKKKWLRKSEFQNEHKYLIDRMISHSNTWLYNSFIYDKKIDEKLVKEQTHILLGMLYPYLTDLGKKNLMEVLSQ